MTHEIRVLDLFSGIAGVSLGLKRAGGFRTIAYCEIDPYCQKVLEARMLDGSLDPAPICTDIRRLDGRPLRGLVDLIVGGFPCQDISTAGHRAGIDGERSGLWSEMLRLVRQVRPRFVLVENVAALLERGMDRVLGDLHKSGFDAEWSVVSACSVGASHVRERLFILAHPRGLRSPGWAKQVWKASETPHRRPRWTATPRTCRATDGLPYRVERLAAAGNAVVPQVAEWIGHRLKGAL